MRESRISAIRHRSRATTRVSRRWGGCGRCASPRNCQDCLQRQYRRPARPRRRLRPRRHRSRRQRSRSSRRSTASDGRRRPRPGGSSARVSNTGRSGSLISSANCSSLPVTDRTRACSPCTGRAARRSGRTAGCSRATDLPHCRSTTSVPRTGTPRSFATCHCRISSGRRRFLIRSPRSLTARSVSRASREAAKWP
ncbi:hypothetical protein LC1Hm_3264 [Halomicrobium sp. LC1Hm]|nr:hypothetical protein LC1Hm_3264 [Halomicrobium sp. LC1Hm]